MRLMDALAWNDVTDENLSFYKAIGVDDLLGPAVFGFGSVSGYCDGYLLSL